MKWIPFADSVAVFPSQGEELFFLGGGFLVGFEEGLLWYAHEHRKNKSNAANNVGGDELTRYNYSYFGVLSAKPTAHHATSGS